jgi:hypothetical protein
MERSLSQEEHAGLDIGGVGKAMWFAAAESAL